MGSGGGGSSGPVGGGVIRPDPRLVLAERPGWAEELAVAVPLCAAYNVELLRQAHIRGGVRGARMMQSCVAGVSMQAVAVVLTMTIPLLSPRSPWALRPQADGQVRGAQRGGAAQRLAA